MKILQPSIYSKLIVHDKVDEHQKQLTNVMDQLAPLKRKKVHTDMKQPWYDEQLTKEIWPSRLKERIWKSSDSEYDYNALQYKKTC